MEAFQVRQLPTGRRYAWRVGAVAAAVALVLALGVPPVRAGVADTGYCTYEAAGSAAPGLSMTPGEGAGRYEGSISCRGVVSERYVGREPGTIVIDVRYGTGAVSGLRGGDDCVVHSGYGTIDVTLSTDKGRLHLHGPVDVIGGPVGEIHGHLGSSPFRGVIQFQLDPDYPDENCVTSAQEHAIAEGQLLLGGPGFGSTR
jgi:hypothetical protein